VETRRGTLNFFDEREDLLFQVAAQRINGLSNGRGGSRGRLADAAFVKVIRSFWRIVASGAGGFRVNVDKENSKERKYNQMIKKSPKSVKMLVRCIIAVALSLIGLWGTSAVVSADEANARRILKAMSDYMGAQKSLSFEFDAILEVVTTDDQKLQLASSGAVTLNRPDKIRVTRTGGFADVAISFEGHTLTLLGKNYNLYTQLDVPGTIDHLIDELRGAYQRPLPAADLLLTNSYDGLMLDVVDAKDLGVGVIGGVLCDHLAFRKDQVDFQIWIAQGKRPYPCRYVITSKDISGGPQYTIQFRDWKTGDEVAATDFSFRNPTGADKVDLKDLKGTHDLPDHYMQGDAK
jgi:hypothetical protein